MIQTSRARGRQIKVEENIFDKAIRVVAPQMAQKRLAARAHMALFESYIGASKSRRATKEWNPFGGDPDTDSLFDLPTLRARSRDMIKNEPIAAGAILTKTSHVVGTGLTLHSRIEKKPLGMTDQEADDWQELVEQEWSMWWDSKYASADDRQTGSDLANMLFEQYLTNGDVFVYLPRIKRIGSPYRLALQPIEADRICNAENKADQYEETFTLAGGIKRDSYGKPLEYHVLKQHPGNIRAMKSRKWDIINAYSRITGLPNIIHILKIKRPGQSRGIPDLAPVIEPLKQLGRYTEAELMAAVVSGLFTVFIENESGDGSLDLTNMDTETGGKPSDPDIKLASGAIVGLAPGEKVSSANPGRPNTSFDPFVQAIFRQIGVALGLPFELLIKHFQNSYSAARAALNEAWEYFMMERSWFAQTFYQEIYRIWMYEAVSSGRIYAPGYFDDPLIQWAYLGAEWTGPARQPINETAEVTAAEKRISLALSTRAAEAAKMTGSLVTDNIRQLGKEKRLMKEAGLLEPDTKDVAKIDQIIDTGGQQ